MISSEMTSPSNHRVRSSLEDCLRTACLMEAAARKPGNVHPAAAFDDLCYEDFARSAEVVAPILSRSGTRGVGRTVLDAVQKTQAAVGRNTNLGMLLLLAPLAAVPEGISLGDGITDVLKRVAREDAALVYEAIRLAEPGGLGRVSEQDVSREPSMTLLEVMQLAAERDQVAAQYASGFDLVLHIGVPILAGVPDFGKRWEEAIITLHLTLMAQAPDTLIARKCGWVEARQSAVLAQRVLDAGWPDTDRGRKELQKFDRWLRDKEHRRNPGTTADLVAACLFAALRDGYVQPPAGFRE